MASWMVHLRIAGELLPDLRNIDETAFVMGNIAPDSGVPNADWTEFHPPKTETHFEKKAEAGTVIDTDAFMSRFFCGEVISGYSVREYSFFLGYYVHLLTDVRWTEEVYASLKRDHPREYEDNKSALIGKAKGDWYDLDFLYLERHPDFRAFAIYENAIDFENEYMEMFSKNAFENRRRYICAFYRGGSHGDLYREYRYLTPEAADSFVKKTSTWIMRRIGDECLLKG